MRQVAMESQKMIVNGADYYRASWALSSLRVAVKPICVQAICPTRIDLTGGFTDVLPFRATQWVSHISLAMALPITISIRIIEDAIVRINDTSSKLFIEIPSTEDIEEIRFSLVKTALQKFGINSGISITIDSKAPSGAGLGTSGALSVALVAALAVLTGKNLSKRLTDLAIIAAELEQASGVLGGLQDQFAATVGGMNLFQFYQSKYSVVPVRLSKDHIKQVERRMLILYPGGRRRSSDIVIDVMNAYKNGDPGVGDALNSLNSLAPEIFEALQSADWASVSLLLSNVRKHQLMLHPSLIDSETREIMSALQIEGIDGFKLLGGGGAGACVLVVCIDDKSKNIVDRISQKYGITMLPVKFMATGVQVNVNRDNVP